MEEDRAREYAEWIEAAITHCFSAIKSERSGQALWYVIRDNQYHIVCVLDDVAGYTLIDGDPDFLDAITPIAAAPEELVKRVLYRYNELAFGITKKEVDRIIKASKNIQLFEKGWPDLPELLES